LRIIRLLYLLLFDLSNNLIELLQRFDLDEFVGALVARVWYDQPEYDAGDCVVDAQFEFGKEEKRGDDDLADC
jgi:hypothetical protein